MDHPETGISSPSFFNVNNGSFRVFEFEFVYADDSFIADDELTEYFRFQVPMGQTDFTICLGSEDFEDWAYWQAICFCPWSTAPVSGFIEGKFLLTGAYEISVNLEWINLADQPETLLFTQTFFPAP
ncbi:MAG TPA: hypothetical protein DCE41_23975 [Cytophagales bacterium]|nr:hypothetical protein [Cytophagales bacterium]HAA20667.1 hypothetical protein [Cytophagales bacterium]HAP64503.1 hypothetical protein [Cytophagales bacterium]